MVTDSVGNCEAGGCNELDSSNNLSSCGKGVGSTDLDKGGRVLCLLCVGGINKSHFLYVELDIHSVHAQEKLQYYHLLDYL